MNFKVYPMFKTIFDTTTQSDNKKQVSGYTGDKTQIRSITQFYRD